MFSKLFMTTLKYSKSIYLAVRFLLVTIKHSFKASICLLLNNLQKNKDPKQTLSLSHNMHDPLTKFYLPTKAVSWLFVGSTGIDIRSDLNKEY